MTGSVVAHAEMHETIPAQEQVPGNEFGQENLPIFGHKQQVIQSIANNPVTIIVSPTGTGKTTQIPQYAHEMGVFDDIIASQPRILATRELSDRVDQETNENIRVGYYTSRESTDAPQDNQHIRFLTDGKIADQLLFERHKNLGRKRLLIIDEVHEWNPHTELLIALAKSKTDPNSLDYDPDLKVVVMSATMDSEGLVKHFGKDKTNCIEVEGRLHNVDERKTQRTVESVILDSVKEKPNARCLVFVAGISEIRVIKRRLEAMGISKPIIPLHAKQSKAQQDKAKKDYPEGAIIIATNVAESSITLPDVDVVIDQGLAYEEDVNYDIFPTGCEELNLINATRSSLKQRAGRTGRTAPGKYFLANRSGDVNAPSADMRAPYQTPAIYRSRLDSLLLKLICAKKDISEIPFYHKPKKEAISASHSRLFNLGAIDEIGEPTRIGRLMSRLPLDPEYASMVARAKIDRVPIDSMQHIIDIAVIMQLGGIFDKSKKRTNWKNLLKKDDLAEPKESDSDFFAQLEAYCKLINDIPEADWDEYHINEHAVKVIERDRQAIAKRLGLELNPPKPIKDKKSRNQILLYINLGQINQIWQRVNGELRDIFTGFDAMPSDSTSVALGLGEFVTGKLFCTDIKTLESAEGSSNSGPRYSVEGINRIPNIFSRDFIRRIGHLVNEIPDPGSLRYNPNSKKFYVTVRRNLGSIALADKRPNIDDAGDWFTNEQLSEVLEKTLFAKLQNDKAHSSAPLALSDVKSALDRDEPEYIEYGFNHISGDKIYAYRCGNGKWSRDRDVAMKSLEARFKELTNAPTKISHKKDKDEANSLASKLRGHDGWTKEDATRARVLLNKRPKNGDLKAWIDEVNEFLELVSNYS